MMQTPANQTRSAMAIATPLITPKFDPRCVEHGGCITVLTFLHLLPDIQFQSLMMLTSFTTTNLT